MIKAWHGVLLEKTPKFAVVAGVSWLQLEKRPSTLEIFMFSFFVEE